MNKDNKTTEYLEQLKDIKLSESSRARIENNLLEYARFHGVRVGEVGRSIEQVPQRTSLFTNILNLNKKSMTALMLTIMLVIGGGTSYAAEGAIPGDFLYTVKTEVNENVKSALAVSNEAEAKLQARLAEERLEEAEKLAVRGKLTAKASSDISSRLKTHYEEVEKRSNEAEAKGDFESSAMVRASLEGTFRTHADVLTDLNARVSGNDGSLLIANIRTYADVAAKAQATATVGVSVEVKSDVENTIKRADILINEVSAKLARNKSKVSAESYARVEVKLAEAVSAQAEAKASLRAEAYQAAYTSVQAAVRIANEVSARVNSMLLLKTEVELIKSTSTEAEIDTILDSGFEADVRTNVDGEMRTESDNTSTTSETDQETENPIDVKLDVKTDTKIETDAAEVNLKTDAAARSGLSL